MLNFWPFKREIKTETRAVMSGFTAELISARESYISGRRGIAEITATAQAAISLWEAAFASADVSGSDLLSRSNMALAGRSVALRGEALFLIRDDRLVPSSDWELRTRDGVPVAYRVSISEAGGGTTETALAGEVLHFRIGSDPATPWLGSAPLRRARLTAGLLHSVEAALAEVFEFAPIGSQIVPYPETPETDMTALGRSFKGQRGRVLLRESVAVSAAGGPVPATDWRPADVTPDLSKSMTAETLNASRDAILTAFGILPALFNGMTTGPLVREAQRHLATWTLQPMASIFAEEATDKLGDEIKIDIIAPLQAFDQGARARTVATLIEALAAAKTAGLDPGDISAVFAKVTWDDDA